MSVLGELTESEIEDLLGSEVIARIGCISDGRVYVVPVTYVYDGTYIWGHAMDGAKLRAMRSDPEVCVEVEHVDDLSNWRSVIARGRFEECRGADWDAGMAMLCSLVGWMLVTTILLRLAPNQNAWLRASLLPTPIVMITLS